MWQYFFMPHDHHDDDPHSLLPPDPQLQVKALETLLSEKGLIDRAALDAIIDVYQNQIGPQIGAEIVARAWLDPAFKERLLEDAEAVLAEMELAGRQGEHVVVVENTEKSIIWSFAPYAAVIHGRFWEYRLPGTNQMPIAAGRFAPHVRCWQNLACICRKQQKSGCGILRLKSAI